MAKKSFFGNFINKSRSILMLHKISNHEKCAPKLIFFYEKKLERFGWFLKLKIDFENQILAFFDGYFNNSHEKIKSIFVISAIKVI
jgi:hypothetical protein